VLSACNSGRGRATAGGDVVGLIRAVLASGAGSVVASLWPVGDVAGCLVMTRFYEHLVGGDQRPGVGAAVALHRAAADVRAMSPGDRRDAYAALAERVGATGEPASSRGLRPVATAEAADTAAWAPFVHVGR
jgi:CHAT domain-containing protein